MNNTDVSLWLLRFHFYTFVTVCVTSSMCSTWVTDQRHFSKFSLNISSISLWWFYPEILYETQNLKGNSQTEVHLQVSLYHGPSFNRNLVWKLKWKGNWRTHAFPVMSSQHVHIRCCEQFTYQSYHPSSNDSCRYFQWADVTRKMKLATFLNMLMQT